jgi:hypothetical protein
MYHGWFSASAAKKFGYAVYLDKDGLEIRVTEVCSSDTPTSKWNDAVYVGFVDKCIKGNNINFDISPEQLLFQIQDALAEQKRCENQFKQTGNCFCYVCPITKRSN